VIHTNFVYNDYSTYIKNTFGERVQKISINTGYSCPNRDGTKGIGGCTYCNINSIKPSYALAKKSVSEQLKEGIDFFSKKYKAQKYLAYFQSYTNTYHTDNELIKTYDEALQFPQIIGLVIGTRPDCISNTIADYLQELSKSKYISVELGIESTNEFTLQKINRCHTFQETIDTVNRLANRNILVGGHLILGFPWESKDEMILHAKKISKLPISFLKIHHLQIHKFTQLAKDFEENPNQFNFLNADEYLELIIEFLENLRSDIVIQRFITESPKHLLLAPFWDGIKNYEFSSKVEKKLIEKKSWQGKLTNN
jgi:radical SAM protein (TIGR01212 family)